MRMSLFFNRLFNMSVSGCYIVAAVLLLRLALKKAPKWLTLLLWAAVGVRLVCPYTFQSFWSLIPSMGQIDPRIHSGSPYYTQISVVNSMISRIDPQIVMRPVGSRLEQLQRLMPIAAAVWLLGFVMLMAYSVYSYRKVGRRVLCAVRRQDGSYQCETVRSPFVFGFIKPKIYLPCGLDEQTAACVIAHERSHIRGLDHLWKPLGFVVLALHWFNPLIWLSYILFCRDLEFACDERVIKNLTREGKADYAQALLTCSVGNSGIAACPLAFGEVGVKKRIKSVFYDRKPAFWIIVAAVLVCSVAVACFFTEPVHVYNMGIRRVSVKQISDEEFELRIKYAYCYSGFHVQQLTERDMQYVPDGAVPYDGSLGKNRILVSFGDDEPTASLARQLKFGEVVELKGSPIRILAKAVTPGDHGFAIYFGMDENIQLGEIPQIRFHEQKSGVIRIPVRIVG